MDKELDEVLPKNSNGKYSRNEIETAFEVGAKWQAERMYSEDDLRRAYTVGKHGGVNQTYYDFDEWFKQNKKK